MYDQEMVYGLARDRYEGLLEEATVARRALKLPGRNRLVRLIRTLMLVLF
jgi:hypothetical protein